jgi:excisionase family DNA binding protein
MKTSVVEPLAVPLSKAPGVFGVSRSTIYRLARENRIKLLKLGRTTLVDADSARALLASLPDAPLCKERVE